jgi:glycosyltransferase involved in cell wall biosynthesis
MRVLHVVDRLGGRGGAEEHLRAVVAELVESGYRVRVIAGNRPNEDELEVTVVPGLDSRDEWPPALEEAVADFDPDVVHLQNVTNPAVLEWAAARDAVVTVQDHRDFCPGRGKWTAAGDPCREAMGPALCAGCFDDAAYFQKVLALTERRLQALRGLEVVVLSRYMKGELLAVGLDPAHVHVIPPFVHGLEPAAAADGPPCVGFVGRLARAKGVDEAVAAWRASCLPLPLVFAGTGPERTRLERYGFEVLGWLDRGALSRFYRRATAVVLPSRWQEPFGIVGMEALSLGTPVAAWDSGGVAEWCDPSAMVPWGDVEGLARVLREVAESPLAPVRRFGAEEPMEQLVALYNSMAATGRSPAALR